MLSSCNDLAKPNSSVFTSRPEPAEPVSPYPQSPKAELRVLEMDPLELWQDLGAPEAMGARWLTRGCLGTPAGTDVSPRVATPEDTWHPSNSRIERTPRHRCKADETGGRNSSRTGT